MHTHTSARAHTSGSPKRGDGEHVKPLPDGVANSDSDGGWSSASSSSATPPRKDKKKNVPRLSPAPPSPKPRNANRRNAKTQDVDLMIKVKRDDLCIFYIIGAFMFSLSSELCVCTRTCMCMHECVCLKIVTLHVSS